MSGDAWLTLAVVLGVVYVLVRDRYTPSITLLSGVSVLLVAGVITPEQAFGGFSNPAPITVAALYVLAGAVEKTGALQPVVAGIFGRAGGRRGPLLRLLCASAGWSAFLNNTPVVAMLAPQVSAWAEREGLSPSRFLMPLSYAAILGGVVTLIGTSTNLVVSGLLEATGRAPLGMFELTPVGLPVALGGVLVLSLLAPVLLPERRAAHRQAEEEIREFAVSMRVVAGGPLEGRTVEAAGLRRLGGLFLIELERGREVVGPVGPATLLRGEDRLVFVGKADQVVELQRMRGLVSAERSHLQGLDSPGLTFFEAVVGEASPLVGRTLKEARFRGRYQAAVVAIHRGGQRVGAKLGVVRLKVGDTLLLLADPGFRGRWRDRNDFLLVSRLGGAPPLATRKAWWVGAVLVGIVGLAGVGALPVLHAALLGALSLLALGVLTPGEARAAVDLDVVVVIAAAFGLGAAIEASGLAGALAEGVVGTFGALGPSGALLGVVAATLVLTELVTNNAAAVLIFPLALSVAGAVGADPRAYAVAVAVAASASFLTPIGYQTNTMVYGPGGYRFGDYARLGLPLTLLVVGVIVVVVPRL